MVTNEPVLAETAIREWTEVAMTNKKLSEELKVTTELLREARQEVVRVYASLAKEKDQHPGLVGVILNEEVKRLNRLLLRINPVTNNPDIKG